MQIGDPAHVDQIGKAISNIEQLLSQAPNVHVQNDRRKRALTDWASHVTIHHAVLGWNFNDVVHAE